MKTMRLGGGACSRPNAGFIDSSKGNAIVTPVAFIISRRAI
jgi:hypothetical protein